MKTLALTLNAIILLAVVACLIAAWNTPAAYGWIVALVGWLQNLFNSVDQVQHGNP